MFDRLDDPEHLIDSLHAFLNLWHNNLPGWYGISPEKLAECQLPKPLRHFYSFMGKQPGNIFVPFSVYGVELLPIEVCSLWNGKLVFAIDSCGGRLFGTNVSGDDPPVWQCSDEEDWRLECDSLAQYLVESCLNASIYEARFQGKRSGIREFAQSQHLFSVPLFSIAPDLNDPTRSSSYYLITHEKILIRIEDSGHGMKWESYGTNDENIASQFPEWFPPKVEVKRYTPETAVRDTTLNHYLRTGIAKSQIRLLEAEAAFLREKADAFRRVLEELDSGNINKEQAT